MSRPLLTLCLMVKDEEHGIARTLESVKPWVDRWLVLDTGSTDRTKDIVCELLGSLPGELCEAPFVDFASSRNLALDRCGQDSEFILWLDADDELVGGDDLRRYLEDERGRHEADREAYYLRVEMGVSFDSARVLRSAAGWRFVGTVHEVLTKPGRPPPVHRVGGVTVRHHQGEVAAERSRARWQRDVGLLQAELERDPDNARAAYYLAMTYSWLERWDEAAAALERRISMAGWVEEIYQSHMQRALVDARRGRPWPEILERYLTAHGIAPHRAEPLHAIAAHYDASGEHALCFLFARRGWELSYPASDSLFVDDSVYAWRLADLVASSAYWIGELSVGEQAARQALRHRPDDARLRENLKFYLERKQGGGSGEGRGG